MVDDAMQPVHECVPSEVEQAHAFVHEAEVGQELFAMYPGEPFD